MSRSLWVYRGLVVAGLVLGLALPAQATLMDRGGGFIYDDVLDITWTQNAGLSGVNTWDNQVAWADALSLVDSVRGVTWDDWRLASMSVSSGLPTGSAASVVNCATATEAACRDNELGYMFYQNLGGTLGATSPATNPLSRTLPTSIGLIRSLRLIPSMRGSSSSMTVARARSASSTTSSPGPCGPEMFPPPPQYLSHRPCCSWEVA